MKYKSLYYRTLLLTCLYSMQNKNCNLFIFNLLINILYLTGLNYLLFIDDFSNKSGYFVVR